MNSNTPTTSPSSDGATSATIASLSPKDLTDEFEQVDTVAELSPRGTFPSTTSVHPKNAFAVSAIETATAGGDNFIEQFPVNQQVPVHQRNHTMLESMMGLRRAEGNETEGSFYRMIIGSMFAYVVLGIFSWTVIQFMVLINQHECSTAYIGLGANLAANGGSGLGFKDASATMSCLDVFTGTLACAHSITFGLISAVVIHEMGSSDDSARNRLSSMIQPIKKRRDDNSNFSQRCFCSLITWLPTVYVVCWTVLGLTCFVFSLMRPDGSTGPLFYTGQTWIGLVIKATYSFFGVEPDDKNLTSSATAQTQGGQQGQPQSEV